MNTEEKANELYPNNKTFCGGVAQIARDAFAKGARMQKEVDDKELTRLYQDLKREYFNGHSFENMFPSEKQKEQKPALEQTLDAYKISDERATAKMEGRIEGRQDVINNPEEYGLQKPAENGTRAKIISKASNEKQVVLLSESDGNAEIGWDTRSLEDTKKLLEYGIAFINKQLGTKPSEWSEDEKQKLNRIYAILGQAADTHAFSTTCRLIGDKEAVELQDFIRSIAKPQAHEWSEEDERMARFYENDYDNNLGNMPMCEVIYNRIKFKDWVLNRLKSLRPQPHWKPSEEQMEAMEFVINDYRESGCIATANYLQEILDQIKKL